MTLLDEAGGFGAGPALSALRHGTPGACSQSPSPLFSARADLAALLNDLQAPAASLLQDRIRQARSLRELWHLRPEVFKLVSLQHSQHEAQRRLDSLNAHFPTRVPNSGFGAFSDKTSISSW